MELTPAAARRAQPLATQLPQGLHRKEINSTKKGLFIWSGTCAWQLPSVVNKGFLPHKPIGAAVRGCLLSTELLPHGSWLLQPSRAP